MGVNNGFINSFISMIQDRQTCGRADRDRWEREREREGEAQGGNIRWQEQFQTTLLVSRNQYSLSVLLISI